MDVGYFDAWSAWWAGDLEPEAKLWGVSIMWWGRIGLIIQFAAAGRGVATPGVRFGVLMDALRGGRSFESTHTLHRFLALLGGVDLGESQRPSGRPGRFVLG